MKVLGLLGLPLLAIALAVMVFAFGTNADTAEAQDGAAMSISIPQGDQISCDPAAPSAKVCVAKDNKFTVVVTADQAPITKGYFFAGAWIDYDSQGLAHKNATVALWPDCEGATFLPAEVVADNGASAGCLVGIIPPLTASTFKGGPIFSFSLTCTSVDSTSTIALLPAGDPVAGTSGSSFKDANNLTVVPSVGSPITVNCADPPDDTPTNTPTNTLTPTPTATPPPIPRMQKCDQADNDGNTIKDSLEDANTNQDCNSLVNVFLTRQGAKIPNDQCLSGKGSTANVAELAEKISAKIVSPDPKAPTSFQQLAAFEFEVHYDATKVCVDINLSAAWAATNVAICIIEDDQNKPQLEGVARIGCVTVNKLGLVSANDILATIDVYPQPDLYSEIKPNQDNGNVVQINNVGCDLGDEQGHAIPIFSCDDADITFRYLEGDVEPDCVIDAVDAQAIAFRWGVTKGSLIYKDFMNLEPSSQQQDNDIDINDLQFVYGRFGSTCKVPHPAQDPVNPKA